MEGEFNNRELALQNKIEKLTEKNRRLKRLLKKIYHLLKNNDGIKSGLKVDSQNITLGDLMHLWLFKVAKLKIKASSFEKY